MSNFNQYNATPKTRTDGESVSQAETDIVGNQKATLATALDDVNDAVKAYPDGYSYKYQAAAAANVVVKATPGYLHAIILGKWVTGAVLECSDSATDGDGNIMLKLTAGATDESGFPKTVIVDAYFATGITCDQTGFTDVTYIYR